MRPPPCAAAIAALFLGIAVAPGCATQRERASAQVPEDPSIRIDASAGTIVTYEFEARTQEAGRLTLAPEERVALERAFRAPPSQGVQMMAALLLARADAEAKWLPWIQAGLRSRDEYAVELSTQAIASYGERAASLLPELLAIIERSEVSRERNTYGERRAIEALAKLGLAAAPYLMRMLEGDGMWGETIIEGLGRMRPASPRIADFLALWGGLETLDAPALGFIYCQAIGEHGVATHAARTFLKRFAKAGKEEAREAAFKAWRQIDPRSKDPAMEMAFYGVTSR